MQNFVEYKQDASSKFTFLTHITMCVPSRTFQRDSHQTCGVLIMHVTWLVFSLFYELAAYHMELRAMRHSPVNHAHTHTHTHTHTQTACIDCDINKQQKQRIAINYAKVCAFLFPLEFHIQLIWWCMSMFGLHWLIMWLHYLYLHFKKSCPI